MDGGGSRRSNEQRGAEKLMDAHLKALGLHRKKIAKDGSCLFRAVAEQVLHCQSLHTKVRAKCVEYLRQNRESYEAFIEGDFEEYLYKLQDPQQWVGEVEINALAVMYKRDFLIFQEPGKPAVPITDNNFKDKVQLCFLNGNHYDSVYPISHIKNAALCQSILYELLYDGVFNVEKSSLGICQRSARSSDLLSDDNMAACFSSDESDLDAGELWVENGTSTTAPRHNNRGRGRGRLLPERVRRSLNPTLFRNIEYDVWHKTKRAQHKLDYSIAAGMQFTAGDRCQVRLDGGRSYNATIKEVPPNNGPVTVYIEELGRKQVPLWTLRPPSEENSWSTVVNRDKRLNNGHGDWEERGGKGRGRGKHVPASSSAAQPSAPGSSGRVLKQHSWPPQATVEEQGGVKANRKSVSSVESAFGLTEEQRLAKEEEERNVALVEIQLRDENSFPALGTQQSDGGRKKGGDKRRSQRNKTQSPVEEDVRAPSPSAGERPKSSTPPLAAAATAPPTNTTTPTNPTPPAAKPPAAPPATASSSSSSLPPACGAPAAKSSAPSHVLAAASSSPPTKPAVPPSVPSSASLFSLVPPVLPAASSPATSHALSSSSPPPSSSPSSLPPKASASPPPSSSLPPPTFIAPIAPSPTAAQGFHRSSPPASSFPHSPNLPPSSSLVHQAAHVHEAPPVSQSQNSLPNIGATPTGQASQSQIHPQVPQNQSQISVSQTRTQASLTQAENKAPLPQNQILVPQMQPEAQSSLQHRPQPHAEVASLPQTQIQPPVLQTSLSQAQASVSHLQSQSEVTQYPPQSQSEVAQYPPQSQSEVAQYPPQSQSEVAQVQSSHPAPGASYPLTSQASVPVSGSVQSQTPVPHPPHLHVQPAQPPHPSQVPHPSPSLSASPSHPLRSQTPNAQNQAEALLPPAQPQPGSPARAPSHPPPPSQHPQSLSAHPPPPPPSHPQSIPGPVPLQQLSQLFQDPLYPGFPQREKGDVAPPPLFSSSKSGDDLPQDVNVLRFFFNLGVKAYTMPMFPPYVYLFPLHQAHAVHPKLHSRSPSPTPHYPPSNPPTPTPHYPPSNPPAPAPHYPPSNPPTRHQEAYPPPQYPPTSAPMPPQYDHQAPLTEPPHPSDPSFNQPGYPVTQPPPLRMPQTWQQHQMPPPRNSSFTVGYPTPSPPYSVPPPLSQGYHAAQGPGHPLYPPYPPSSLGYQSSAASEELQGSQGGMEQRQPANGDTMSGQGHGRVPGLLETPVSAANANSSRTVVPGFALKKDPGDGLSRTVLLVDPPLNNYPILVSNPGVKDVSVSMTTMKPSSVPVSQSAYDHLIPKTLCGGGDNPSRSYGGRKPANRGHAYGGPDPGQVGYLSSIAVEPLSVGCSTEDEWEDGTRFKPLNAAHRGGRRYRGGGRGRASHDPGRGAPRRRPGGEPGAGPSYVQFNASHRGRGRERGY